LDGALNLFDWHVLELIIYRYVRGIVQTLKFHTNLVQVRE